MSITTKLLILLTVSGGFVMLGASLLILRQYENTLENALREDLQAHAVTLQIALEEDYAYGRTAEAQHLIDRLRENTEIYAVVLFDREQNLVAESKPLTEETLRNPPELASVLKTGKQSEIVRQIDGKRFVSIILPMRVRNEMRGAFEIIKPLSLVERDIYFARIYWLSATFLLLAVIFAVVYFVLKRNLSAPIKALLSATEAVGKGDFAHQVIVKSQGDEFARLAAQFNRMAQKLLEKDLANQTEVENRIRLERELRHNEQLVMVGRMAAGVAHELGAPLNVIDARAEQLQKKTEIAAEKRERNLEIIRSNVARITHLVRQLLNLARPFNLNLTAVNIRESVANALEQVESVAESSGVEVIFHAPNGLLVKADPNYLVQVWLNILLNALQEMPDGGKLLVEIGDDSKFASVKITDTGGGILPEHFISLFDPFFTTKDIGKGTGLGLPIANRIVEEHGGKISAENSSQGGASFTVKLPLMYEK